MYEHEWVCRWGHVDPATFAFYPELVDACHEAGDAMMEEIGWAYWDIPPEHGIHLPLVEVGFEFESPVKAGDRIVIEVTPEVGTSSLRLSFRGRHADTGETAFTGFEQHVCMSDADERSTPLPEGLRAALEPYTADG